MQLSTMYGQVTQRLNEFATGPTFYPTAEIIAALNEAERFFAMLTLGLETTQPWTPATATAFFRMLPVFPNWIAPLRLTVASTGAKVRPARLEELGSLDSQWIALPGAAIYRYAALGADLMAIYPQPTGSVPLNVTFARAPVPMVSDTDVPEIPAEYHPALVDYGIYRVRQVEGAQELEKALPLFDSFLDAAQAYGSYVRARNLGSRYDKVPYELERFDRSQLMKLRPDIVPERRVPQVV